MITRLLIVLSVITLPTPSAWAKSRAILFGGYDQPSGAISPEYNDFANNLATLGRELGERGFEIELLFEENSGSLTDESYKRTRGFDGGSRESILSGLSYAPPHHLGYATERSLRARLQRAETELEPGDQLLLAITSHGELIPPSQAFGVRISPQQLLDLRTYARELARLKSKGIRLGFFLTPCYAGTILPFLSGYGCAMSLSPATNVSYSDSLTGELFRGGAYNFWELYSRFLNVTRTDDFPTLSALPLDAANAFSHLNGSEESVLTAQALNLFTSVYLIDTDSPSSRRPYYYRERYRDWMRSRVRAIHTTPIGMDCARFLF